MLMMVNLVTFSNIQNIHKKGINMMLTNKKQSRFVYCLCLLAFLISQSSIGIYNLSDALPW